MRSASPVFKRSASLNSAPAEGEAGRVSGSVQPNNEVKQSESAKEAKSLFVFIMCIPLRVNVPEYVPTIIPLIYNALYYRCS